MASIDLQPGEQLIQKCRRHWIYLYPLLALELLALFVPLVILFVFINPFDEPGPLEWTALAATLLWSGFWGVRAYFVWYRYQNDLWLITDQRLIDSQRKHWFHQELASADLVDVQDTSVSRSGLLRTALNYGDLMCQTAGQQLNFTLGGIPKPVDVLTALDRARDHARRDARRDV